MKNRILLLLSCGLIYVTLSSRSAGIAQQFGMNRTGAGGTSAGCDGGGCHDAVTNQSMSISMKDLVTGDSTSSLYVPNRSYMVRLSMFSSVNHPEVGFQFAASKADGTAAGVVTPTGSIQTIPVGAFEIVEHVAPIPAPAASKTVSFIWKAPGPGSGNITFYAVMMASNDDGFVTGDLTDARTRTFAENMMAVQAINARTQMSVFPNPVSDRLRFSMHDADKGQYTLTVMNTAGQQIFHTTEQVIAGSLQTDIDASAWASGLYFLRVQNSEGQRVLPIVRQ